MTQLLYLLSDLAAACIRASVCLLLIFRLLPVNTEKECHSRDYLPSSDHGTVPFCSRANRTGKIFSLPAAGGSYFADGKFSGASLHIRKENRRLPAALLCGTALLAALLFASGIPEPYRQLPEAVLIALCAGRWLKIDVRMCMFISIYFEIAVSFWQFLLAAGLNIIFRSQAFFERQTAAGQLALWLLYLPLAVFALMLSRRDGITKKAAFRIASRLCALGLLAVVTLSEQTIFSIPEGLLDMWTILAVVLLMALLVFNLNRHYEAERELAELKSQQAELLERDYTALNQTYTLNAKLFHDFHNHIGVLRQLLSREKYEEAMLYLNELQAPIREMTEATWTGDTTVDYLINEKCARAKAGHISFDAQVEFPSGMRIKSADLCAILGNLLDNALEAAKQMTDPDTRFVRLTIRRINHLLIIKVENGAAAPLTAENGTLKTTKAGGGLHGWGLKSARAAAEKYDGALQTSFENGVFRAVATLSFSAGSTDESVSGESN